MAFSPGGVPAVERPRNHDAAVARACRGHELGGHVRGQLLLQAARRPRPSALFSPCSRSIAGASSDRRHRQHAVGRRRSASRHSRMRAKRPAAALEFDPRAALELLPAGHRDDADAAGARHVRAAAGRQIEVAHLDQAQRAGAPRSLRSGSAAASSAGDEPHPHLAVLPHDAVGVVFGGGDLGWRHQRGAGRWSPSPCPDGSSRCGPGTRRSNAADSTCWPVCCCMWSKRRVQSMAPCTRARRRRAGRRRTCTNGRRRRGRRRPRRARPPSVPMSCGWPPEVG